MIDQVAFRRDLRYRGYQVQSPHSALGLTDLNAILLTAGCVATDQPAPVLSGTVLARSFLETVTIKSEVIDLASLFYCSQFYAG